MIWLRKVWLKKLGSIILHASVEALKNNVLNNYNSNKENALKLVDVSLNEVTNQANEI